ncbi:MAG: hypothetical protein AAF213_10940 [Pseudomonadota bacterium]
MSSIQKFMFDNAIFDPPLEPIEEVDTDNKDDAEPEIPPPPGVTLDELARARAEAYEQGLADGQQTVEATAQNSIAVALQHVAKVADYLLKHDAQQRQEVERQVLDGTLAMTKRLFPHLADQGTLERLSDFARQTLNDHADEREILIAVPQGSAKPLQDDLKAVLESRGMTDRVKIVEDQTLAVTDCRITWANGGANMLIDRIWNAIEQAAEQALATHGLSPSDGQGDGHMDGEDSGVRDGDSTAPLAAPGPAPAAFTPAEHAEEPPKPDFSQLPAWLEQAIAEEPSHVIRELGPDATQPLAPADDQADLEQAPSMAPQDEPSAPEASVGEPVTEEPVTEEPVTEDQGSGAGDMTAEEPAADENLVDGNVVDENPAEMNETPAEEPPAETDEPKEGGV